LRFAFLFLILIFCGFAPNENFVSRKTSIIYILKNELGTGAFSSVWEVERVGTTEHKAMKFYRDLPIMRENLARVARMARLLEKNESPNLVRVYEPETVLGTGGMEHEIVLSELSGIRIEELAPTEYRLGDEISAPETVRRIRNIKDLFEGVLSIVEQLRKIKTAHHDLNPKNILKKDRILAAGDFDGATELNEGPPEGAAEISYSPLEYGSPRGFWAGWNGSLNDIFTGAGAVYFCIFGVSPFHDFAKVKYPLLYAYNSQLAVIQVRSLLNQSPEARHAFEWLVARRFGELIASGQVPKEAMEEFSFVASEVWAGLRLDAGARKEALLQIAPHLSCLQDPLVGLAFPAFNNMTGFMAAQSQLWQMTCQGHLRLGAWPLN
jgi:serine/threonine protein kinase